jgi:hypothetical protein
VTFSKPGEIESRPKPGRLFPFFFGGKLSDQGQGSDALQVAN